MPPIVLTFAASDPTGGAGLQADLLTLAALGCHPLSVLTGLTVQDTSGVEHLEALSAGLVARQASALLAESGSRRSRPACSLRPKTCARSRRSRRASERSAGRSIRCLPPDAAMRWQATRYAPRCSRRWCRAPRFSRRTSPRRQRLGGAQRLLDLGARYVLDHRHARRHASKSSTGFMTQRPGARGSLAAAPGQLSRLGMHARFRHRGRARQRTRGMPDAVRDAQEYTWKRSPAASTPAPASCCPTGSSAHDARPLRHYARHRRHRRARRQGGAGAESRRGDAAIPQQDHLQRQTPAAGARARPARPGLRRAVHRQRRRRDRASGRRQRRAPGQGRRRPGGGAHQAPRQDPRRLLL